MSANVVAKVATNALTPMAWTSLCRSKRFAYHVSVSSLGENSSTTPGLNE